MVINPMADENEFDFNKIIQMISNLYDFVKQKFWKLLLIALIGGFFGFIFAFFSEPKYQSKLKFLMRDTNGGSALMSSLGSLGSLIGGAANMGSPLDRILAIMDSERIIGETLFKQVIVNGKKDLVINHFINIEEIRDDWKKDTILDGVKFDAVNVKAENLSLPQRKGYKYVINMFIGEKAKIISKSYDKKSGVFELVIESKNEDFAVEFSKLVFERLEQFLYLQSLTASGKNVAILSSKIDSIKNELNYVQNALARRNDRTLGLLMQEDKVDQKKLMMKEQMLTIMFGEAQKNLETFRFINESVSKNLDIIEYPFSPIKPNEKSPIKFSIIFFILFGFCGLSFLITKKWIQSKL